MDNLVNYFGKQGYTVQEGTCEDCDVKKNLQYPYKACYELASGIGIELCDLKFGFCLKHTKWYHSLKKGDYAVCIANPAKISHRLLNGVHYITNEFADYNSIRYKSIGGNSITSKTFEHWRKATSEEADLCRFNNNRPTPLKIKEINNTNSLPLDLLCLENE